MSSIRRVVIILLASIVTACATMPSGPETPQAPSTRNGKPLLDSVPLCDTASRSGFTNPNGRC